MYTIIHVCENMNFIFLTIISIYVYIFKNFVKTDILELYF